MSSSLKGLLEEDDGMESLTQRQREILADIANGLSNKGISEKYSIALPTVKDHIRLIFEKLDVSNRAGAAALAIRRKMA